MQTKLATLILLITTLISITSLSAQENPVTIDLDEILERVGAEYNVSVACLEATNNLDNFRDVGVLTIDPTCPAYEGDLPSLGTAGQGGGVNSYTVQRGDRLADIAEEFGTTVDCLQTINGIEDANLIFPGQQLIISDCAAIGGATETVATSDITTSGNNLPDVTATGNCVADRNSGRVAESGFYTVQRGDILDFIACDFDVSIVCLIEDNSSLQDRRNPILRVGQVLNIDTDCPGWDGPFNSGILNG